MERYTEIPAWMLELFGHVDRQDAAGFAARFAPDGHFTFANNPPAEGQEGILKFVEGFLELIVGIEHELRRAYQLPGVEVLEGLVTYIRKDGSAVGPLPFCSVFELRGEAIASYRAYVDASPLFSAGG